MDNHNKTQQNQTMGKQNTTKQNPVHILRQRRSYLHKKRKFHGASMGPIWGRQDPGGPNVGSLNFAIWGTCIHIGSK